MQKKAEPCTICGKIISRASDVKRHMKTHNADDEFVLLFSNLLIITIDTYFIGNFHVLGKAANSVPARNLNWRLIIGRSVYYSSSFLPLPVTDASYF